MTTKRTIKRAKTGKKIKNASESKKALATNRNN